MSNNYSVIITTGKSAAEVFNKINDVKTWWTKDLVGDSSKLHDEFEVRFGDVHYSKQKLVEVIPGKKVVWLVTDSKLSFIQDKNEWTNTRVVFDINQKGKTTEVRFTHEGLIPEVECYDACSNAWGGYITGSLKELIEKE